MAAPAKKAKYREKLEALAKAFTDPDYNVNDFGNGSDL